MKGHILRTLEQTKFFMIEHLPEQFLDMFQIYFDVLFSSVQNGSSSKLRMDSEALDHDLQEKQTIETVDKSITCFM